MLWKQEGKQAELRHSHQINHRWVSLRAVHIIPPFTLTNTVNWECLCSSSNIHAYIIRQCQCMHKVCMCVYSHGLMCRFISINAHRKKGCFCATRRGKKRLYLCVHVRVKDCQYKMLMHSILLPLSMPDSLVITRQLLKKKSSLHFIRALPNFNCLMHPLLLDCYPLLPFLSLAFSFLCFSRSHPLQHTAAEPC